jgi:uncharacterized membrane protein
MREIARRPECVVEDVLATLEHRNTPTGAKERSMPNLTLIYAHLASIVPAAFIGAYLLLRQKGTPGHRCLGKIYMMLMMSTAIITLFITAEVGPTLFDHFGFIHLFSILVIYSVPAAYFAARAHNIKRHKFYMLGVYLGAVLIAGVFTFTPGRLMHTWFLL